MGHKQSKLHRQLKATDDGPSRDLVGNGGGDGGSLGGSSIAGPSSGQAPTPFFDVKQGPFKRKLSVRNISIRRSFHKPSKAHRRLSNSVAPTSATTDDIVIASSSSSTLNNSPFVQSTSTAASTSATSSNCTNNHNTTNGGIPTSTSPFASVVDGPSTSSASVSLPARAGSFSRASSSGGGHDRHVMDRIRKSFRNSFRRKKSIPESIKPHQWQADEVAVKAGNCLFPVKYLGCVEVFESRGMQICEDALRRLRNSRRRAVKGTLYVTGDGLRVVDDETKGLLVDQTIEKVSFCAPDRSHERGFSYICRDGTTRRWMCHGFHATKDSGERLSHAVGCAFAVCLERKQRRDKEAVSSVFDSKTATFTRTGSFRASSITERMQDPQVAKAADPIPMKPVHNPYAVERPHAVASLLQRQGSLRGGPLNQVSPFKRQLSLRLGIDSLPTTIGSPTEGTSSTVTSTVSGLVNHSLSSASATSYSNGGRERAHSLDYTAKAEQQSAASAVGPKRPGLFGLGSKVTLAPSVAPIQELSPSADRDQTASTTAAAAPAEDSSIIAAMCQELSQGLSMLAAQTADQEEQQQATAAVFSPGHHHFSPPAATTSSTAAPFSAFDKWISTNSNGSSGGGGKRPPPVLPPPPMVDQMPQVTAPPPPSSPPYATTVTFSPSMTTFGRSPAKTSASTTTTSTDYHSSLFSDLANSLKDNMAAPTLTQPTHTATVPPPPTLSSSSPSSSSSSFIPKMTTSSYHSSHNGGDLSATNGTVHISTFPSSSAAVPVVAATSTAAAVASPTTKADPFDADWVELSSRQVFATPATPAAAPEKRLADEVTPPPPPARAASPPALPYKSTNPFLDLSQFEAQILADTAAPTSPETAAAASSTSPPLPPQPPAAMQMITAFEVQM